MALSVSLHSNSEIAMPLVRLRNNKNISTTSKLIIFCSQYKPITENQTENI